MRGEISIRLLLSGTLPSLAALVIWRDDFGGGLAQAISAAPLALGLHVFGALFFALLVARGTSLATGAFAFSLAFVLPLLGPLTMIGLLGVMSTDAGETEEEDKLCFGNPITAKRSAAAELCLAPIARLMREEGSARIGQMLLGLNKGDGAERGYQILRRYQQDPDVELQFYAQSAQRGATEGLERQLKDLRKRLSDAPQDHATITALAEVLIELAGRRATSRSDASAYVRRALEQLRGLPTSAKCAALMTRGYLLVKEPAAARAALAGLPEGDVRYQRLEIEVLYAERDWARLVERAEGVESTDAQMRTALAFWRAKPA